MWTDIGTFAICSIANRLGHAPEVGERLPMRRPERGQVRRAPGINEDPSICNPYRAP